MGNGEFSEAFRGQKAAVVLLCVQEAHCGVVNARHLPGDRRRGERWLGQSGRTAAAALGIGANHGPALSASLDGAVRQPGGMIHLLRPVHPVPRQPRVGRASPSPFWLISVLRSERHRKDVLRGGQRNRLGSPWAAASQDLSADL